MRAFPVISLVLSIALGIGAVFLGKTYFTRTPEPEAPMAVETVKAPQTVRILVADRTLEAGEPVEAGNVHYAEWPEDMLPAGALTSLSLLDTGTETPYHARGLLIEGEPVVLEKLALTAPRSTLSTNIEEGHRAVSIQVSSVTGVSGFVLPDDRVDVIMVSEPDPDRRRARPQAELILQDVRVLAIDQTVETAEDGAMPAETVTLEVTPDGAARISLASSIGKLSLALRGKRASDAAAPAPAPRRIVRLQGATPRASGVRRTATRTRTRTDIRLIQGDQEVKVQTPVAPETGEANS